MERVRARIYHCDQNLYYRFNCHQGFILSLFHLITHLGGARFTIGSLLVIFFLAEQGSTLKQAAVIGISSLTVSHVIVTGAKRIVKRIRPYIALDDAKVYGHPFNDHSFPSGHSTAIFSITVPFMILYSPLVFILLPVSLLVALSRVVLGVHYPTDVFAGAFLGMGTGIVMTILF
ncbi:phosphatase PAP2 family protein [Bacillus sp. AK031]